MLTTTPLSKALFIKLNILVDQDCCARLADFGLLTIVSESTYRTSSSTPKSAGTTRWMSPELLDPVRFGREDGRATKESDCYALGMVILEVLSGKLPFSGDSGLVVMRKVIEGERPGRPEGKEEVWFTDDLWEILEQCWLPQPERRPTIEAVLECLEQGSTAWQPPPPDSDDYAQSDSDDQSYSASSHDSSTDPSTLSSPCLKPHSSSNAFAADRVNKKDDGRIPIPSTIQPHSVYASQDSHQLAPGNQPRLAELPVSTMSDITDMFVLYDNPRYTLGAPQFHRCRTS